MTARTAAAIVRRVALNEPLRAWLESDRSPDEAT